MLTSASIGSGHSSGVLPTDPTQVTLNIGLASANAFSCFLTRALAIFARKRLFSLLAEFQFLPAGCYLTSPLISWLFSKPIRKEFTPLFAHFLDILLTSVTSTQRSMNVIQPGNSISAVLSHTAG